MSWTIAQVAGRVTGGRPPNLFLTLGRHPALFRGWLRFAGRLMPRGKLPRRETELVILRVAHVRDCRYEHDHHVRLGPPGGAERRRDRPRRRRRRRPRAGRRGSRRSSRRPTSCWRTATSTDETWSRLSGLLDTRELIELVLLVGHYEMLAKTINTLRIQPDG